MQRGAARPGVHEVTGVLIKMGQVLSVIGTFFAAGVPGGAGAAPGQGAVAAVPRDRGRLKEAFGDDPLARFARFDREPIAAASLAQVHRARTLDDDRDVAVKVLYPNIERIIRSDLAVMRSLLPVIRRLTPVSRVERVLDQLTAMLAHETDYRNEHRNIEKMRAIFADKENVVVPDVVEELTRGGVLALSFEEGAKITDVEGQRATASTPRRWRDFWSSATSPCSSSTACSMRTRTLAISW